MSSDQLFLAIKSGVTCWIPSHIPTQEDLVKGRVVMLPDINPVEEQSAMMIYFNAINLVDDVALAARVENGKTHADIINKVTSFKSQCMSDPSILLKSRYTPQAAAVGIARELAMTGPLASLPSGAAPLAGGLLGAAPPATAAAVPAATAALPPAYGGANGAVPNAAANPLAALLGGLAAGAAPPPAPGLSDPNALSLQPAAHQQPSNVPRTYINIPDPFPAPDDVSEAEINVWLAKYDNPDQKIKFYLSPLPKGMKPVVWTTYKESVSTTNSFRRLSVLKGGICLILNPDESDMRNCGPVKIATKPICTFFMAKGLCARPTGCSYHHWSEEQVKRLIAIGMIRHERLTEEQRWDEYTNVMAEQDMLVTRESGSLPGVGIVNPTSAGSSKARNMMLMRGGESAQPLYAPPKLTPANVEAAATGAATEVKPAHTFKPAPRGGPLSDADSFSDSSSLFSDSSSDASSSSDDDDENPKKRERKE